MALTTFVPARKNGLSQLELVSVIAGYYHCSAISL